MEIRWHGRGGQGAVTASEIVAMTAIKRGYYAMAFPEFGAERRGAPVKAFTRIMDEEVLVPRTPILEPDIIVILDPSLLTLPEVLEGVREGISVIANTVKTPEELAETMKLKGVKVVTVDATKIAVETLGRPIVNTAILGALNRILDIYSLDELKKTVLERFPGRVGEANILAVEKAYKEAEVKTV